MITIDTGTQTYKIDPEIQIHAGYPVTYDIVVKNGTSATKKYIPGLDPEVQDISTPTGYTDMLAAFPTGNEDSQAILAKLQEMGLFLW